MDILSLFLNKWTNGSTEHIRRERKWKWSRSVLSNSLQPLDCRLPGSSFHGIFQERILEWVAISFSRGSSRPKDWTRVSHTASRCFYCLSHHRVHMKGNNCSIITKDGIRQPDSRSWTSCLLPQSLSLFRYKILTFMMGMRIKNYSVYKALTHSSSIKDYYVDKVYCLSVCVCVCVCRGVDDLHTISVFQPSICYFYSWLIIKILQ